MKSVIVEHKDFYGYQGKSNTNGLIIKKKLNIFVIMKNCSLLLLNVSRKGRTGGRLNRIETVGKATFSRPGPAQGCVAPLMMMMMMTDECAVDRCAMCIEPFSPFFTLTNILYVELLQCLKQIFN